MGLAAGFGWDRLVRPDRQSRTQSIGDRGCVDDRDSDGAGDAWGGLVWGKGGAAGRAVGEQGEGVEGERAPLQ